MVMWDCSSWLCLRVRGLVVGGWWGGVVVCVCGEVAGASRMSLPDWFRVGLDWCLLVGMSEFVLNWSELLSM